MHLRSTDGHRDTGSAKPNQTAVQHGTQESAVALRCFAEQRSAQHFTVYRQKAVPVGLADVRRQWNGFRESGFGRVHYISGSVVVRRRAMRRIDSMSADSFSSQLHARTHALCSASTAAQCSALINAPDGLCVSDAVGAQKADGDGAGGRLPLDVGVARLVLHFPRAAPKSTRVLEYSHRKHDH